MKTNFRQRQFLILLVFALIPLLVLLFVAMPGARQLAEKRTQAELSVVGNLLVRQVETNLSEVEHTARLLAIQPAPKKLLQAYLNNPSAENKAALLQVMRNSVTVHRDVNAISIISPTTGKILLSTDEGHVYNYSDIEKILQSTANSAEVTFTVAFTIDGSAPMLAATTPIRSDNGTLMAISVACINLDTIAAGLTESAANLDTGRAYLIDGNGRLLTVPPSLPDVRRYSVIHTTAAEQLRAGKSGVSDYYDAAGKPVIGAYRWLPQLNLGIIVELDHGQVTESLYSMLFFSLLLVLGMMIFVVIAARFLNNRLMEPLMSLTEAANAFRQERFSHRITVLSDDEFGQVAQAFNQMAERLEESYQNLTTQVQARTTELQSANQRLQREIEDRIRIETELRQSEERFRTAFSAAPDSVTITGVEDGRYVEVNDAFLQITGYTRDEVIGKTSADINIWVNTDDRRPLVQALRENGELRDYEVSFRLKDGSIIDTIMSARLIPIQGEPHIIIFARDISALKQAQQALRESEERYHGIFENSPVSLWEEDFSAVKAYLETLQAAGITDIPGYLRENLDAVEKCASLVKILDINRATLSVFGAASKEELLASLLPLFLPETYPVFAEQIIALWEQKPFFVADQTEKNLDGQKILVRVSVSPAPGSETSLKRVFISIQDMTVQVRAQQALEKRNQELSLLNRIIASAALDMDETGIFETTCYELAEIFGAERAAVFMTDESMTVALPAAEHRTDSSFRSIRGWRIPVQQNFLFRYLVSHQAPLLVEDAITDTRFAEYRSLLNHYRIGAFMLCPIVVDSKIVGTIGVAAETPRKFSAQDVNLLWSVADQISGILARIRLAAEHQRLVAAIEQIAESLIITDTDANISYVNPTFERVTGYSRREVLGKSVKILYPADAEWHKRWRAVAKGQVWQGQITSITKNGERMVEDETLNPLRDAERNIVGIVAVRRDITRELELENQYYQAQKMDAIGRLTGGVAHDFNNVLTAINGFAELMLRRLEPDAWEYSMVNGILKSGQRAAGLVRQLLLFSQKKTAKPRLIDLNTAVGDMQKMLQRIIGEDIEFSTNLAADLWKVKADPTQIEQVVVNLVVNARDALPDGGHLTIETVNREVEPKYIRHDLEMPAGKYVQILVTDDGTGIPASARDHIFEPFFTTKEKGKGTGLGLATVYGIIHQHNGFITVDSEVGRGTTFNIYLPAVFEDEIDTTNDETPPHPQQMDVSGTETILVVEDEVSVREMAVRVLRQAGYTVYAAANGIEGLAEAEAHLHKLDVVLTDVVMPKMNGKVMAEEIYKRNHDIKILFMSGYLSDIAFEHDSPFADFKLLEKPFSPSDLLHFVRRGLDTP